MKRYIAVLCLRWQCTINMGKYHSAHKNTGKCLVRFGDCGGYFATIAAMLCGNVALIVRPPSATEGRWDNETQATKQQQQQKQRKSTVNSKEEEEDDDE